MLSAPSVKLKTTLQSALLAAPNSLTPVLNWLSDWHLLFLTLLLTSIGSALVLSASVVPAEANLGDHTAYFMQHFQGLALGLVVGLAISRIPLVWLRAASYPAWIVCCLLLVATLFPGVGIERNFSSRWLKIGPLPLFQPLELAKLSTVLALAHGLAAHGQRLRDIRFGLGVPAVLAGVPAAVLLLQPDFGGALLLCACAAVVAFVAGARISHMAVCGALVLPVALFVLGTRDYRSSRVHAWMSRMWYGELTDPKDRDYHAVQCQLGFIAGGLTGCGLGGGEQRHHVPEPHTDSILSIAGEELGLVGVTMILASFLGIAWCSMALASRATDPFGMFVATGAGVLLWLQAAVNAGVAMDLLPTKGTTLPFLSYGRSSLVASLAAIGLLLNVARNPGFPGLHKEDSWP